MLETITEEQRRLFITATSKGMRITRRQMEVLELIADGYSTSKMAAHLGLQEPTIKTYIGQLFELFSVETRAHLVSKAFRAKVLK